MRSAGLLSLLLASCAFAGTPRTVVVALAPEEAGRSPAFASVVGALELTARGPLAVRRVPVPVRALPWRFDPARILLYEALDSARAATAAAALAHAPGVAWTEVESWREP